MFFAGALTTSTSVVVGENHLLSFYLFTFNGGGGVGVTDCLSIWYEKVNRQSKCEQWNKRKGRKLSHHTCQAVGQCRMQFTCSCH